MRARLIAWAIRRLEKELAKLQSDRKAVTLFLARRLFSELENAGISTQAAGCRHASLWVHGTELVIYGAGMINVIRGPLSDEPKGPSTAE